MCPCLLPGGVTSLVYLRTIRHLNHASLSAAERYTNDDPVEWVTRSTDTQEEADAGTRPATETERRTEEETEAEDTQSRQQTNDRR